MGYGSLGSSDWDAYSVRTFTPGSTADTIYRKSTTIDPKFDAKGVKFRESRDSTDNPESNAIIVGLDVTGSMGGILEDVAKRLGEMVLEIYKRKPVAGPQIMFNAIGDYPAGDRIPFQTTQFESDIKIAEQLTSLVFGKQGGGNNFESYPLAWYFAARHTSIDCYEKRGKKGFIFTMGDDGYPSALSVNEINDVFGDSIEKAIPTSEILAEVNRKYEVFHLCLAQGGSHKESDYKRWQDLLGERAILVTDSSKIPEIIISLLEALSGKAVDDIVSIWHNNSMSSLCSAIKPTVDTRLIRAHIASKVIGH